MNHIWTRATVVAAALIVAGCSSSSSSSSTATTTAPAAATTAPAAATTAPGTTATVGVGSSTTVGAVLVDSSGITLYRNTKESGGTIACTGGCASVWPPLTVSAGTSATAGAGLTGTIGTISRPDGTTQVTYNGWPLYRYSKDAKAGDATGQGVGGIWYAMTATTAAAGPTSATTGPTTTAYSGY